MTKITSLTNKKVSATKDNPIENFRNDIFDQLIGRSSYEDEEKYSESFSKQKEVKKTKKEVSLFNYQEHYENQIIKRQIKELTEAIKKEIEMIKKSDKSLLSDITDIQKLTIESLPSKPGIYDIRFLEIVLGILKALRAKVGESKTWMQALLSKKKKRGSLFAVLSKKKGTQYSLSQEHQSSRSVQ